jgi:hypothetical protein
MLVYADGSTRTINDNVDLRAFAAAITRAVVEK